MICGDGPELAPLVAEAQRREMKGRVHFLGHVGEPERFLVESDVVLNPSDSDGGMPLALVEALLAGTPVSTTAAGGTDDLIADERDGRLVPTGDAAGLYRELCATLDEAPNRAERAARAEARFDLKTMGLAHLELLKELIG